MSLYLGIDGGGTKTKVNIINDQNMVVFENTTGPSSIDTVDKFTTIANIRLAIQPYIDKHPNTTFKGVFAGLGGIVFMSDNLMVESLLRQLPQVNEETFVRARNDMHTALYSSDLYNEGMALICGTGMVAFGLKDNLQHKCGGWGHKEGELGSAYDLGRRAIRYCVRAYDERYPLDDFAKEIAQNLNLSVASDIINVMDNFYNDRTKTASLAPIVTSYANQGNVKARKICNKAIDELVLAIKGVYKKLKFNHVTLVIVGSLGNAKGYFNTHLKKKIHDFSTKIKVISPVIDPALAAAKAAKHFCEVKKNDS